MVKDRSSLGVVLLLGVAVGLGMGYALVVPFGEKPDEPSHMARIVYEARFGRTPPVASSPVFPNVVTYEALQPPLYYKAAAWVLRRLPEVSWSISPASFVGCVERWRRFTLDSPSDPPPQALVLRLLGLVCTAASGLCVFLTARMLRGTPPQVMLATALSLLTPQVLFVSTSVSNDALALSAGSLVLMMAVRAGISGGTWVVAAGALAMLSIGIKLNCGPYLLGSPVLILALRPGGRWRASAFFLAGAAAAAAPVLAMHQWHDSVDQRGLVARMMPVPAAVTKDYLASISDLLSSYWARFGWMDVEPGPFVTTIWIAMLVLTTVGWMARSHAAARTWAALWIVLAVAVLGWMLTLRTSHQVQGRFLFPFTGVIALLVARGMGSLPLPGLGLILTTLLLGANLLSLHQLHGRYRPAEWPEDLVIDAHQCHSDRIVLETLSDGAEIAQTFYSSRHGLSAIDVVFAGRAVSAKEVMMTLSDEVSGRVLAEASSPATELLPGRYHRFRFTPVARSGNRLLRLTLRLAEVDPGGTLSLWFSLGDPYIQGFLHVSGVSREGDMRFVAWADRAREDME